jgi:hypothetical protein
MNARLDNDAKLINEKMDQLRIDLKEDIKNDLVPRIAQNESEIAAHDYRIVELETTVATLQNQLELQSRSLELIVRGVPETANEKCQLIYRKMAEAIGCAPGCLPIADAFRLGRRPRVTSSAKSAPILIRFVNKHDKIAFHKKYFAKKNLNLADLGFPGAVTRVYVTENLTSINNELFGAAMKMKKDGKLASVSTYHGIVNVKIGQNDRPRRIRTTADLDNLR